MTSPLVPRDPRLSPRTARVIDRMLAVQRPVVLAHLRTIRRGRPDATAPELVAILERRYLAAVTGGGALVGASSAIPGVGVAASLALSGVETAGFLETTALFAQSIAEVHGIAVDDPDRARVLVMALLLGDTGQELVQQVARQAGGNGTRSAYWGEVITGSLPRAALGPVVDRVQREFVRRFVVGQGAGIVGRMIPFGIGAVVGGAGNHLVGRRVIQAARRAFGPAPDVIPASVARPVLPPPDPAGRRPE